MELKNYHLKYALILLFVLTVNFYIFNDKSLAQSVDQLQEEIEEKKKLQEKLDKELAEQRAKLEIVSQQKNTLQNTVNTLDTTERKITKDINVTENKIDTTETNLVKIDLEIKDKLTDLEKNSISLAKLIRSANELESESLLEKILVYEDFSEFFNTLYFTEKITNEIESNVESLKKLQNELENKQEETSLEKEKLEKYKLALSGEKQAVNYTKKEKEQILAVTKNTESEYQRIVKEKEAARSKIEGELSSLEEKLKYTLDPSKIPSTGSGVLAYPIENPFITQGFGLTPFALSGAYGYDSSGGPRPHRAIDFRAAIGTKILSSADGVVRESYNMDAVPGCRSYGQWILIDHYNGLSTLYTHLSVRSVSPGAIVSKGDLIGLAGQSGYATGPHLHFGVFPKDGVNVEKFSNSIGCKNALIPLAAPNAYLNPLNYLK